MRVRVTIAMSAAMLPCAAQAQFLSGPAPQTIVVAGVGRTETPPDVARLSVSVQAEGKTADEASAAIAAKLKAIAGGLASLDRQIELRTGTVAVSERHAGACPRAGMWAPPSSAATVGDPCAVIGFQASSDATITMHRVEAAGTAVGLASRLGASEARLASFGLSDSAAAQKRAVADALAKARAEAEAIAAGSGMRLGALVSVTDGSAGLYMAGSSVPAPPAPPPPIAPAEMRAPAIPIEVHPAPVQTEARVTVTFALER